MQMSPLASQMTVLSSDRAALDGTFGQILSAVGRPAPNALQLQLVGALLDGIEFRALVMQMEVHQLAPRLAERPEVGHHRNARQHLLPIGGEALNWLRKPQRNDAENRFDFRASDDYK